MSLFLWCAVKFYISNPGSCWPSKRQTWKSEKLTSMELARNRWIQLFFCGTGRQKSILQLWKEISDSHKCARSVCILTETATRVVSMRGSIWTFFHQKISIRLRRLLTTFFLNKNFRMPWHTFGINYYIWSKITRFYNIWCICAKVESPWIQTFGFWCLSIWRLIAPCIW